jgi:N-acetylglucosamine kinase-like BadF-type ATPase
VGGIGRVTTDFAGGGYLAREVVRAVYSAYCRDGEQSVMVEPVSELIGVTGVDTIMDIVHDTNLPMRPIEKTICQLLFSSAAAGDKVARDIISHSAAELAASVAGCYKLMAFPAGEPVDVVLAGSVWAKCGYPPLSQEFRSLLEERIGVSVNLIILEEPPALGAVLWAYELACGSPAGKEVKEKVLAEIRRVRSDE